jgi:hypothetical protein
MDLHFLPVIFAQVSRSFQAWNVAVLENTAVGDQALCSPEIVRSLSHCRFHAGFAGKVADGADLSQDTF